MNALALWAIVALVLVVFAGLIGRRAKYIAEDGKEKDGYWLGILIDDRQRFSLTHLQVVLWSLVLLSLLTAIFLARLFGGVGAGNALNIKIPTEILALAGITSGSAVLATATKSPRTDKIRAEQKPTHFSQVFMVEEGANMDKVVDVTRFQNFFLTLITVGAYIILAATALGATSVPAGFPDFGKDLLWLIGISHAAYVGGKFPEKK